MQGRVELVRRRPQRRMDVGQTRSDRLDDFAAALVDLGGCRAEVPNHPLLENRDAVVERVGDFAGAPAKRLVDLAGFGGKRIGNRGRTCDQHIVDLACLAVERARDLAPALAEHTGDFKRAHRQRVVQCLRPRLQTGVDARDQLFELPTDFAGLRCRAFVERIDMAAENRRGFLCLLFQSCTERNAVHGDGLLYRLEMPADFPGEAARMLRDARGDILAVRAEGRLECTEPIVERRCKVIAMGAEPLVDTDRALCNRRFEGG